MIEHINFLVSILPDLWEGLVVSLKLSAGALSLGLLIGLPMSLARTYGKGFIKWLATAYIEIVRGTPMIVQLFIVYFRPS
ncbi:MAG: ABC transporter permease subunit [Tepidanaerobacteraceae bacterium]